MTNLECPCPSIETSCHSPRAARNLATSERHLRSMVFRREIPYHKVGRLVRFDLDELDAWLDAHHVEAES